MRLNIFNRHHRHGSSGLANSANISTAAARVLGGKRAVNSEGREDSHRNMMVRRPSSLRVEVSASQRSNLGQENSPPLEDNILFVPEFVELGLEKMPMPRVPAAASQGVRQMSEINPNAKDVSSIETSRNDDGPDTVVAGRVRAMTSEAQCDHRLRRHRRVKTDLGADHIATLANNQNASRTGAVTNLKAQSAGKMPALDLSVMPLPQTLSAGRLFATKRPTTDPCYRALFYDALLKNDVTHIVDLRESEDVADYRPAQGETCVYGPLRVTGGRRRSADGLMFHSLLGLGKANTLLSENDHTVEVSHFRGWPDFGVISPQQLRDLGALVNGILKQEQGVVVHCRGGVGRTGTLVTYCQTKAQLDELAAQGGTITESVIFDLVNAQRGENVKSRRRGCMETFNQVDLVKNTLREDFKA